MAENLNALRIARYERQRGDMLLLLKEDFGQFMTVRLLGDAMGRLNHALTDDDVRFHLQYLADKGMVDLQRHDVPESRERNVIFAARLNARGVDFLDGRGAGDMGVSR